MTQSMNIKSPDYFDDLWRDEYLRRGERVDIPGNVLDLGSSFRLHEFFVGKVETMEDDAIYSAVMSAVEVGVFPGACKGRYLFEFSLFMSMAAGGAPCYLLEPGDGFGYLGSWEFESEGMFECMCSFKTGSHLHVLPMALFWLARVGRLGGRPMEIVIYAPGLVPRWVLREVLRLVDEGETFGPETVGWDQFVSRVSNGESPEAVSRENASADLDAFMERGSYIERSPYHPGQIPELLAALEARPTPEMRQFVAGVLPALVELAPPEDRGQLRAAHSEFFPSD